MNPLYSSLRQRSRWLVILTCLSFALIVSQGSWSSSNEISPRHLLERLDTPQAPLVIDVRSEAEFSAGHVPGALNIPYRQIPDQLDRLSAFVNDEIIVYCEVGIRASIAGATLEQSGFQRVRPLAGHMVGWREADFPVEFPSPPTVPHI